jgi:branched-chain amino acid aminotransferase
LIIDILVGAANGGIGLQKLHNYAAQFYQLASKNAAGFQQVIWTDDATHTKWKRQVR